MAANSGYWFERQPDPLAPYYPQLEQSLGLPPGMLSGVVAGENTPPGAVGASGETSQFQILPSTARELGVNPHDEKSMMHGSAQYLQQQMQTFGDPGLAYAAYNAGPGTVQAYLQGKMDLPESTKAYVKRALAQSKLDSDWYSKLPSRPPAEGTDVTQYYDRRNAKPPAAGADLSGFVRPIGDKEGTRVGLGDGLEMTANTAPQPVMPSPTGSSAVLGPLAGSPKLDTDKDKKRLSPERLQVFLAGLSMIGGNKDMSNWIGVAKGLRGRLDEDDAVA